MDGWVYSSSAVEHLEAAVVGLGVDGIGRNTTHKAREGCEIIWAQHHAQGSRGERQGVRAQEQGTECLGLCWDSARAALETGGRSVRRDWAFARQCPPGRW